MALAYPKAHFSTLLMDRFGLSGLDGLRFTDLHKAYLGLSGTTFVQALPSASSFQIDAVDGEGRTTLSWASGRGDEHAVSRLLQAGADPNVSDSLGRAPLHFAAQNVYEKCVSLLLSAGADIERRVFNGMTALILAAGDVKGYGTVKILLANGAKVDAEYEYKCQVLHYAANRGCSDVVALLLQHGARLNVQNCIGDTPLTESIFNRDSGILRLLMQRQDLQIHLLRHQPEPFFDGHENLLMVWVKYGDLANSQILYNARETLGKKHKWPRVDIEEAIQAAQSSAPPPTEDEDYSLRGQVLREDLLPEWFSTFEDFAWSMMRDETHDDNQNALAITDNVLPPSSQQCDQQHMVETSEQGYDTDTDTSTQEWADAAESFEQPSANHT